MDHTGRELGERGDAFVLFVYISQRANFGFFFSEKTGFFGKHEFFKNDFFTQVVYGE